jgi:hypothetical protein
MSHDLFEDWGEQVIGSNAIAIQIDLYDPRQRKVVNILPQSDSKVRERLFAPWCFTDDADAEKNQN